MAVGVPTKARVVEENESDETDLESEPGDDLEKELPTLALNRASEKESSGETQNDKGKEKAKKARRKRKPEKVEVIDESGSEGDVESEEDEDVMDDSDEDAEGQSGLANVMAKILATKKSDILCKAKKGKPREKRESDQDDFEVEENGVVKKVKKVSSKEEAVVPTQTAWQRLKEKKLWDEMSHVKPDIKLDKEKEKRLKTIATKGVVQLLSAIDKHNKTLKRKLAEAQGVTQKEKVLERTGKEAFLDILKGEGEKVNKKDPKIEVKDEVKEEGDSEAKKPKWSVLADDFYKEPTLDGWDKQESDDD